MGKGKKITVAIILLLLLCFAGYWLYTRIVGNAQLEKVKEMQKTLFTGNGPPNREKMEAFRVEMDKLTPGQRFQLMDSGRQQMEVQMKKRLDDYFAMDKAHRAAFLDAEIKRMEDFRKQMEKNGGMNGRPGPGGPGGPGGMGGPPPGGMGGPPPGGAGGRQGPPRGGPPPGGPPASGSTAERTGRNFFLNMAAGAGHARFGEFMSDMAERRVAAGLSPRPEPPRPPSK
jgi:hypothetical protein